MLQGRAAAWPDPLNACPLQTNNSTQSRRQYVAKLATHGIEAGREEVLSSAFAAAEHLRAQELRCKSVYVVGEAGLVEELSDAGFHCIGAGEEDGAFDPAQFDTSFLQRSPVGAVVIGMDRCAQPCPSSARTSPLCRAGGPAECARARLLTGVTRRLVQCPHLPQARKGGSVHTLLSRVSLCCYQHVRRGVGGSVGTPGRNSAFSFSPHSHRLRVPPRDTTFPFGEGVLLPGAGAGVAALAAAVGRCVDLLRGGEAARRMRLVTQTHFACSDPEAVVGKPSQALLRVLVTSQGLHRGRTLMVGDRLNTDIAFGKAGGLQTLLVMSGVTTEAEAAASGEGERPDWVAPTVATLADLLGAVAGAGGAEGEERAPCPDTGSKSQ